MDARPPIDAVLLDAGGWAGVGGAVVLAKGWDGDFCAAVVNTRGGDETNPYSTIVECFSRDVDDNWSSMGHHGPVSRGGGSGSVGGLWNYEYGFSDDTESWWVVALDES